MTFLIHSIPPKSLLCYLNVMFSLEHPVKQGNATEKEAKKGEERNFLDNECVMT